MTTVPLAAPERVCRWCGRLSEGQAYDRPHICHRCAKNGGSLFIAPARPQPHPYPAPGPGPAP